MQTELSIIIVNWNVKDLLQKALQAIEKYPPAGSFEVFVVDNASQDKSAEMVKNNFPQVKLICNEKNLGFAGGNNAALKKAQGDVILLLNPDTEVQAGALQTYIDFFKNHPRAGALGVKLLNSDRTLQPSCKSFPSWRTLLWNSLFFDFFFAKTKIFGEYEMSYWDHGDERQVDQPMGAALAITRNAFKEIGLMDEQFYMFFDEVDWCYRIKKAGYQIWFTPHVSIIHHWGKSTSQARFNMNKHWHLSLRRFMIKYSSLPKYVVIFLLKLLNALKFFIAGVYLIAFFYTVFLLTKVLIGRVSTWIL